MAKNGKDCKKGDGLSPDLRNEQILQDLANGLSKSEAARRNGVHPSHVTRLLKKIPEAKAEIAESHSNILADRQKRWDEFIEQESEDILTLCRDSTTLLKAKLAEAKANPGLVIESRKEVVTMREPDEKNPKGVQEKTILEPVVTLERASRLFKEIHSLFASLQKGAADVPPPSNA
jgi:transposase